MATPKQTCPLNFASHRQPEVLLKGTTSSRSWQLTEPSAYVSLQVSRTCLCIVPGFLTSHGSSLLSQPLLPPQVLLQPGLPYPAEVRMVRKVVGGGNIAIAGAQNPHKQLRILHLPEAHLQLSAGTVMGIISGNTGTNVETGPWLTTERWKAGCSLASKEPSTTLSPQASLQLQACPPYVPHPTPLLCGPHTCSYGSPPR